MSWIRWIIQSIKHLIKPPLRLFIFPKVALEREADISPHKILQSLVDTCQIVACIVLVDYVIVIEIEEN